jgi:hypothetical protein
MYKLNTKDSIEIGAGVGRQKIERWYKLRSYEIANKGFANKGLVKQRAGQTKGWPNKGLAKQGAGQTQGWPNTDCET